MSESSPASGRSPFAGCAILIAALGVMVFLVVFSTWTLFRQYDEIVKFTKAGRTPIEMPSLEGRESGVNALAEKIEVFRQVLAGEGPAELPLTVDELNLAISLYEPFKDLRGGLRVVSADDGILRLALSFPLNGKPRLAREGEQGLVVSDPRYLEGVMVARPGVSQREVVLHVEAIEVPGATVPREFVEQMSPYRISERYLTHPEIGPAMAKLTRVTAEDGRLVFARVPGEKTVGEIDREGVDGARNRLFGFLALAACVFLVIAGLVVFVGLRRRGGIGGGS